MLNLMLLVVVMGAAFGAIALFAIGGAVLLSRRSIDDGPSDPSDGSEGGVYAPPGTYGADSKGDGD